MQLGDAFAAGLLEQRCSAPCSTTASTIHERLRSTSQDHHPLPPGRDNKAAGGASKHRIGSALRSTQPPLRWDQPLGCSSRQTRDICERGENVQEPSKEWLPQVPGGAVRSMLCAIPRGLNVRTCCKPWYTSGLLGNRYLAG